MKSNGLPGRAALRQAGALPLASPPVGGLGDKLGMLKGILPNFHSPCFFIRRYNAVRVIPKVRAVVLTLPS